MLANPPYLRYNKRHHPIWILRRLRPTLNDIVIGLSCSVVLASITMNTFEGKSRLSGLIITLLVMSLLPGARVAYVLVDWRTRDIRLYSDGRLDYESGILIREGQSVSMRFGATHYRYPDRFCVWLDCADLMLPFDAGIIPDIPDFREFWDIAQGRA